MGFNSGFKGLTMFIAASEKTQNYTENSFQETDLVISIYIYDATGQGSPGSDIV
jgi:hypothetical protein